MKIERGSLEVLGSGAVQSGAVQTYKTVSVRSANSEAVWKLLCAAVFALLLTRASLDPILNLLGGDDGGSSMGLGAVLNAVAITIAFALLALWPSAAPLSVVAGIWGPFMLATFGATIYAPDFGSALRLALVLLSYWSFFVIPFLILRSSIDVSRFILLIIASSVAPSLYALVDIARGFSDMSDFRLQSTFSHPNIFAFYLVLVIGLVLYVRASQVVRVTSQVRILVTLYLPVLMVFLMLTKTRSAWVTCGLMFLVYALWIDRRFLAGLLLVPLLLVADPSLVSRFTDITAATEVDSFAQLNESTRLNSYVWRQALWESAFPSILEKPLLGHGLASFKSSTPSFFPLIGPEGIDGHNFYLQMGFEMGLLGVLTIAWLLGSLASCLIRGTRIDPRGAVVMICILVGYALESYSDNMHFYLSFNWYFWFVMGTICAWICNERALSPEVSIRNVYAQRLSAQGFRPLGP